MNLLRAVCALWVASCLLLVGCSKTPARVAGPKVDAAAAAQAALEAYDTNKDGKLDATELKQCPALAQALPRADTNHDQALSADEIAARIEKWLRSGTAMMSGATLVTIDGRPLAGATVTFEPEKFLGEGFKSASGQTDATGRTSLRGANEKYPGVYVGFYRVRISKIVDGKETIPARYNTASEIGCEVADDIGGIGEIEFRLQSR